VDSAQKTTKMTVAMTDSGDDNESFTLIEKPQRGKNIRYLSRNLQVPITSTKHWCTSPFKSSQMPVPKSP